MQAKLKTNSGGMGFILSGDSGWCRCLFCCPDLPIRTQILQEVGVSPAHPPRPSVQTRCGLHTRLWPPLAPQVTSHSFSQPWIALKPEMLGHPLPWTAATLRHLLQARFPDPCPPDLSPALCPTYNPGPFSALSHFPPLPRLT